MLETYLFSCSVKYKILVYIFELLDSIHILDLTLGSDIACRDTVIVSATQHLRDTCM